MGILDFFKKKPTNERLPYTDYLDGTTPIFSQFGQDIYASDVVQNCISCITMELKKLNPTHIRAVGNDKVPVNSNIQRLLSNPNERMTTSDFIEKVSWTLFLKYNSFIVPTYDLKVDKDGNQYKYYTGLYPINPTKVEFRQDASGTLYVWFQFMNGYETQLLYSDVIHLKYRYSKNEFLGGNERGLPDHRPLLKTLELNDTLLQGVKKGLESSFAINGIVKYNTLLDEGKTTKAIKELESHLKNNESGFLPMDLKGEFIPLSKTIQLVDDTTLKFIDEKILRNFGVPIDILTGDYTKECYESFYNKTLEPIVIAFGQEFTKKLFTPRELGFRNQILFYPSELIFMSNDQKIKIADILVDSGAVYKNELRTMFGMSPLNELIGQIAMSSNLANAVNNASADADFTDKEDVNGGD